MEIIPVVKIYPALPVVSAMRGIPVPTVIQTRVLVSSIYLTVQRLCLRSLNCACSARSCLFVGESFDYFVCMKDNNS